MNEGSEPYLETWASKRPPSNHSEQQPHSSKLATPYRALRWWIMQENATHFLQKCFELKEHHTNRQNHSYGVNTNSHFV